MKKKLLFITKHLLLAATIMGAFFWAAVYRKSLGAEISSRIHAIERTSPDIILVGNSVLKAAIDEEALSAALQKKVLKVTSNGSATAWWYLYLKNVLSVSQTKPQEVILFFRDHYLTDPTFRTQGKYLKELRMMSTQDEPLLAARAFKGVKLSASLSYACAEAKERFERRIVKVAANLTRVNKNVASQALADTLGESAMIPELLSLQQLASEQALSDSDFDFDLNLPESLLPEMVQTVKEQGIKLTFVRCKRRRDIVAGAEPPLLVVYEQKLREYFKEQEVNFIDTAELALNDGHFGPGDHLNDSGKALFTEFVAERLK